MSLMKTKLAVLVLGLFVSSACGGEGDPGTGTTSPTTTMMDGTTIASLDTVSLTTVEDDTIRITVSVGVDSGPDRIEEVSVGDAIELTLVNPDEDDEFHVHGFDLGGDETPAGDEKVFAFTASEAGDYEVESHVTGDVLVVIRVS